MKVWELDLTSGKQYRGAADILWVVKNGSLVRECSGGGEFEISEDYSLEDLLKLEFTEVATTEEKEYISLVGRAFLYAVNTLPYPAIIYGEPHNEAEYLYTVNELIDYYTKENAHVTK